MVEDIRRAARGRFRRPGVALATLALGLGAAGSAYAVIEAVLIRPLAFDDPERLVLVRATIPPDGRETSEITFPDAGPSDVGTPRSH